MAISCAEMITSNIQVVDLITCHCIYAVKARSLEKFQVEVIPCETKIVHHVDFPCEFLCTWMIYEFTRTTNAFTFTYKSCIGFEIRVCLSKLLFLYLLWGRILHGTKYQSKNIKLRFLFLVMYPITKNKSRSLNTLKSSQVRNFKSKLHFYQHIFLIQSTFMNENCTSKIQSTCKFPSYYMHSYFERKKKKIGHRRFLRHT